MCLRIHDTRNESVCRIFPKFNSNAAARFFLVLLLCFSIVWFGMLKYYICNTCGIELVVYLCISLISFGSLFLLFLTVVGFLCKAFLQFNSAHSMEMEPSCFLVLFLSFFSVQSLLQIRSVLSFNLFDFSDTQHTHGRCVSM